MPEIFWDEIKNRRFDDFFFSINEIENNEVEVAIVRTKTLFNSSLMDSFPSLSLIIRAGSGYDNIDLIAARERNIRVCTTPGANTRSAFEHTISLILALLKRHQYGKKSIILRTWKSDIPRNWELSDLRALIVGAGRIGSLVADFLTGSGSQVKVSDPYISDSEVIEKKIELTDYNDGLKWCNLITYHCPLSWETRDYFNIDSLEILNNPVWLVNVARGSIVNEEALISGLENQLILGAALDVFDQEPWYNEALTGLSNVYLTPHTGSYTKSSNEKLVKEVIKTWSEFCDFDTLREEVDYRFYNNDPKF
jgi:D-3-phosphoglycerate dehydrogenase